MTSLLVLKEELCNPRYLGSNKHQRKLATDRKNMTKPVLHCPGELIPAKGLDQLTAVTLPSLTDVITKFLC